MDYLPTDVSEFEVDKNMVESEVSTYNARRRNTMSIMDVDSDCTTTGNAGVNDR